MKKWLMLKKLSLSLFLYLTRPCSYRDTFWQLCVSCIDSCIAILLAYRLVYRLGKKFWISHGLSKTQHPNQPNQPNQPQQYWLGIMHSCFTLCILYQLVYHNTFGVLTHVSTGQEISDIPQPYLKCYFSTCCQVPEATKGALLSTKNLRWPNFKNNI